MSNIKYFGLLIFILVLTSGILWTVAHSRTETIFWEQNTTLDLIEIKEDVVEVNNQLVLLRIEMDTLLNRIAAK
jgi:hypothetical protein